MNDLGQVIKNIRPSLRIVAPQTYWFSIGFGLFNTVVGVSLYNITILLNLNILGIIPIRIWGLIFLVQGILMLGAVAVNNWKVTRLMHFVGVGIKTAWWLELLSVTITGRSAFLLYVWSLLLFLQFIICIYFTPRMRRAK